MASRRFRDWDDDSDESSDGGSSSDHNSTERATNMFANDGSFLELFKKKMEEMQGNAEVKTNEEVGNKNNIGVETSGLEVANNADDKNRCENQNQHTKKASLHSFVGKRRGGKLLPTGMVKKVRKDDMERESRSDAWTQYMKEVRKYKEQSCEDEGKRRPLVK